MFRLVSIWDHIDFGYLPLVDIGDFVWEDSNYNGLQDINEKGYQKQVVYLWNEVEILWIPQ